MPAGHWQPHGTGHRDNSWRWEANPSVFLWPHRVTTQRNPMQALVQSPHIAVEKAEAQRGEWCESSEVTQVASKPRPAMASQTNGLQGKDDVGAAHSTPSSLRMQANREITRTNPIFFSLYSFFKRKLKRNWIVSSFSLSFNNCYLSTFILKVPYWAQLLIQEKNAPFLQTVRAVPTCLRVNRECKGNAKGVGQAMKITSKNFTRKYPRIDLVRKATPGKIPGLHSIANPDRCPPVTLLRSLTSLTSLQLRSAESAKGDDLVTPVLDFVQDPSSSPGPYKLHDSITMNQCVYEMNACTLFLKFSHCRGWTQKEYLLNP